MRTLTFWLRPEFVLRVVNRFQKVAGFDRSIALASAALTATIPLMIVASAVASDLGGKGTADRIIDRYELTGGGAEAVKDIFAPPVRHEHEPRHHRVPLPAGRGPELHPGRAAAVRADLGAQPAERPQHVQRAALDRRAGAVPRGQRPPPRRAGAQPPRARSGAARRAADGGLPGLERPGAQRQADRAPGPPAVRHRRLGAARGCTRLARRCMCRTSSTHTPPAMA